MPIAPKDPRWKTAAASPEAQRAWKDEMKRGVADTVAHALDQEARRIYEMLSDFKDGKFDSSSGGFAYSIMRHKPMKMSDAQFAQELSAAFREWKRGVQKAIES